MENLLKLLEKMNDEEAVMFFYAVLDNVDEETCAALRTALAERVGEKRFERAFGEVGIFYFGFTV